MNIKKRMKSAIDYFQQPVRQKKPFGSKDINEQISNLKHQFDTYLQVYNTKTIPIEQLSLMLQKYFRQKASLLGEIMFRSSKSQIKQISWDNLLQFMYEDISLKDRVSKINKTRFSVIQAAFDLMNPYQQVLRYVLRNQTNRIRKIVRAQMSLRQVLLIHLDGQILIYDQQQKRITNHLQYCYIQTQKKILQKNKHKKDIIRQKKKGSQNLDQVKPISINHRFFAQHKNQSQVKSSMRISKAPQSISGVSSAISVKKRTCTEISQLFKKLPKKAHSSNMKYRHTQTDKVFKIFQDATLQNSIEIAKSFIDSKHSFKSHIHVQKSWLLKDTSDDIYQASEATEKRNFKSELRQMSEYNTYLSKAQKNQINTPIETKKSYYSLNKDRRAEISQKIHKKGNFKHLQTLPIQIECFSIFENYLLVGLHSRQVRLYEYKRLVQSYKEQLILQKTYQNLPINVFLYRSQVRKKMNITVCLSTQSGIKITVEQLSSDFKIMGQSFKTTLDFTPIFQQSLPIGFTAYNEKGWLSVIQLNSPLEYASQRKAFEKCFKDPEQNNPICFNCVKMHNNCFQYYAASKDGKVYCIDRYSETIRIHKKVANNSILDLIFFNNCEDILIYLDNFEIKIINPVNLQVQFSVQPNLQLLFRNLKVGKLTNQIILLEPQNDRFGIYSERGFQTITVNTNLERKFNNEKPIKILNSRQRLLQKKKFTIQENQQEKMKRENKPINSVVIQRWFVQSHYLAILGQNYQLQIFDSLLQYVGSYHNLQLSCLILINVNNDIKYLANYYESGDIQVVNIYTQQSIFNIIQPHQTIHTLFFGGSSDHFLGIATNKNMVHLFSQSQRQSEDKKIKLNLQQYHPEKISLVPSQTKSKQNVIKVLFLNGKLLSWKSDLYKSQQNNLKFITVYHQKSFQRNYNLDLDDNLIAELKGQQSIFVSQVKPLQNQNSIVCSLNQKVIIKVNLTHKQCRKIYPLNNQIPKRFINLGNNFVIQFLKARNIQLNNQKQGKAFRFLVQKQQKKDQLIIKSIKEKQMRVVGKIQMKQHFQIKSLGQFVLLKAKKSIQAFSVKGNLLKQLSIQNIGL